SNAWFGLLRARWNQEPAPCRESLLSIRLRGEPDCARRALTRRTRQVDLSPVGGDDGACDAQAQARATLVTAASLVYPVEAVEDMRQVLSGDANTGVVHQDHSLLPLRLAA